MSISGVGGGGTGGGGGQYATSNLTADNSFMPIQQAYMIQPAVTSSDSGVKQDLSSSESNASRHAPPYNGVAGMFYSFS